MKKQEQASVTYQQDLWGNPPQAPSRRKKTEVKTAFFQGQPFVQGDLWESPQVEERTIGIPGPTLLQSLSGEAVESQQPLQAASIAATVGSAQLVPPEVESTSPIVSGQERVFNVRPLVTLVRTYNMTLAQKDSHVIPTPLCIIATKADRRDKEVWYRGGIVTERNPETGRQRHIEWFHQRSREKEEAYTAIEIAVRERGLTAESLQPVEVPEPKAKIEAPPEPGTTEEELAQNPLLEVLKPDEIYVDPCEVTIEEAEEKGYPLLRRDVATYKWWLEFPFDTREQPELHQGLKDAKWRWGGYRQQWYNPAHFPEMPTAMQYANAGPALYSEENVERIEARATKARDTSSAHLARSDQLASIIPFGQPMMPGHHSYRSDLSYRKKIWKQMDLFVEFYKKAEWLENRADGSRRLQGRRNRLSSVQNRIDTLSTTMRSMRRNYEEAKGQGVGYLDYYRKCLTILAQEMLPLQAAIAERGGLPIDQVQKGERPLQPGDYIQVRGKGVYVIKVNAKTIKVADPKVHYANGKMWELTYKRSDFQQLLATREEVEADRAEQEKNTSQ